MTRTRIRIGWAITGLVAAFLALDGAIKLVPIGPVTATMVQMGWPGDATTARGLGVLLLAALALHLVPRTAFVGALLLTAYLGGAVATHARIGSPLLTHQFFGIYVGVLLWAGYALRDARLRAFLDR